MWRCSPNPYFFFSVLYPAAALRRPCGPPPSPAAQAGPAAAQAALMLESHLVWFPRSEDILPLFHHSPEARPS